MTTASHEPEGPESDLSFFQALFRPSRTSHVGVAGSSHDLLHPRGRILPPLPRNDTRLRRFVRGLQRLVQGLYFHEVSRIAPAMAFHFFLSLLPLLAFVGYVVGVIAQRRGVSSVIGMVLTNLPEATESVLQNEVSHLANARRLGPLAAVGFLWIASGGIQGLMEAVEMVVGAPRRAWWKQRLLAVGWVVAVLVLFGLASLGLIQWDDAVQMRGAEDRAVAIVLSLAAALVGLGAFYRFSVTHSRTVRRRVLPGAVLALGLWLVVSWAFSLYIRTLASYTVYYGSLAAVAVLLVWLWLVSLAILVGAELNSQLEGLRD